MTFWLSYGGGVNSTALLLLLLQGKLPQCEPWRIVWADTRDEKDETYAYIYGTIQPLLHKHGRVLEIVCDKESVIARWERTSVVGSRLLRTCTDHAKIRPIGRHIKAHGAKGDVQLVGIDAGEEHRAKPSLPTDPFPKRYPLVEAGIDREGCVGIIRDAGIAVPPKSGCWHCPFMRKAEVLALAKERPDRFGRILALEDASLRVHPLPEGVTRESRAHWHDRPAREWAAMACESNSSGPLFQEIDPDPPCACYDGGDSQEPRDGA